MATSFDDWTCAFCGTVYPFARIVSGMRGGPEDRALDRRYGFQPSCWRNSVGKKKCPSHGWKLAARRVILLSLAAPNPPQPEQKDPKIKSILKSYEKEEK